MKKLVVILLFLLIGGAIVVPLFFSEDQLLGAGATFVAPVNAVHDACHGNASAATPATAIQRTAAGTADRIEAIVKGLLAKPSARNVRVNSPSRVSSATLPILRR